MGALTDEHVDRFTMGPHVHRHYRARATKGPVWGESRLSPEHAIESYYEALSEASFEPEKVSRVVVRAQAVGVQVRDAPQQAQHPRQDAWTSASDRTPF